VSMFGPRMEPESKLLKPVSSKLIEWIGPVVSPGDFPTFDISYETGETKYLNKNLDAESSLSTSELPSDLSIYDMVHVVPLSDAVKQLEFIHACKKRGVKKISAGTGLFIVKNQLEDVKAVMEQSDLFFMNRIEAETIFGSIKNITTDTKKIIFITDASKGVLIIQGQRHSHINSYLSNELDPTGAGDTFCGATLSDIVKNNHPVFSAQKGAFLASKMIENIGPDYLLKNTTIPKIGFKNVSLNENQIHLIAESLSGNVEVEAFDFINPDLPEKSHPFALDYFFVTTLHQFGFWMTKNNHYDQPMIAQLDGEIKKGSDYLWRCFYNKLQLDPQFFSPKRQAEVTLNELNILFRSDSGINPIPSMDRHLDLCRSYGRDMMSLGQNPIDIINKANSTLSPLTNLLSILDYISGYKEDPLRKKSNLLSIILHQRPEKFLRLNENDSIAPIIDYHVMRSCLRMGLIDIENEFLKNKIISRSKNSPDEEWEIRYASFLAFEKLVKLSGKSMGAVDIFFFRARQRCPEMTSPDCSNCSVELVCSQNKELFQPVIRTDFY